MPPAGANPAVPAAPAGTPTPAGGAANIAANPGISAPVGAPAGDPAQAALNAGAPGNIPGAPAAGAPGAPGAPGAGGGANAITGEPGSVEYVISKLISMAKSGDYTGIETVISEKAKGLAGEFREQDLKPTQIENYKTTFDGLQLLNQRAAGNTGRMVTFKKGETVVQVTVAKENGSFKIKELKIQEGKIK